MANRPTLRAGVGAEAEILTKMIQPRLPVPHHGHRSRVILTSLVQDKNKRHFLFHLVGANATQVVLRGSYHYVKVVKEGDPTLFFDTDDSTTAFQEPNIPWRKSRARKILYTDIKEGRVPRSAKDENGRRTTDIKTVYLMHPEYALWDYNKFSSRLAGVRKIIGGKDARAQDDQNAFDLFVENNEIHSFSRKGYIQWKGSESQRLLKKDIQDGIVRQYGSRK